MSMTPVSTRELVRCEFNPTTGAFVERSTISIILNQIWFCFVKFFTSKENYQKRCLKELAPKLISSLNKQNALNDTATTCLHTAQRIEALWKKIADKEQEAVDKTAKNQAKKAAKSKKSKKSTEASSKTESAQPQPSPFKATLLNLSRYRIALDYRLKRIENSIESDYRLRRVERERERKEKWRGESDQDRVGEVTRSADQEIHYQDELKKKLLELAREWKRKEKCFAPGEPSELTHRDDRIMGEVVSWYPKLAELLLEDPLARKAFFLWTMQDQNSVDTFVLFPKAQSIIVKHHLSGYLGSHLNSGETALKISVDATAKKIDLTLPFCQLRDENRISRDDRYWTTHQVSILNMGARIGLTSFGAATVQTVFNTFKERIDRDYTGSYEWKPIHRTESDEKLTEAEEKQKDLDRTICGGITPWHAWEHSYNRKSFSFERDWWIDYPIAERLSEEQVRQRYRFDSDLTNEAGEPRGDLADKMSFVSIRTAIRPEHKDKHTNQITQAHGYLEVGIRREDGSFDILAPGKFVWESPGSRVKTWPIPNAVKKMGVQMGLFGFLANTVPAAISLTDENRGKRHRVHSGYSFVITSDELYKFMTGLGKRVQMARDPKQVTEAFSFADRNCIWFANSLCQEFFKQQAKPFPDLCHVNITQVEFPAPIRQIIAKIGKSAKKMRWFIKMLGGGRVMHLGSSKKGKVSEPIKKISLLDSLSLHWDPNNELTLPLPAALSRRVDSETGRFVDPKVKKEEERKVSAQTSEVGLGLGLTLEND